MAMPRLERVNTLWFVTLGVTALAAAILVYILLIESALGAFSIREANPFEQVDRGRPTVALLNSDYTRQAHRALNLKDTSTTWIDQTLLSWREFLIEKDRRIPFRDITDQELEEGAIDDFDVLILPSVRAMSDLQIQRIKEFMERGGSVFATWTPGVYREDGSWRGWDFVEDVFGVEFQGFVERGVGNYRVYTDTFPGITPAGLYQPAYLASLDRDAAFMGSADEYEVVRQQKLDEARASDFAPLDTYEWFDSLGAQPPARDFAQAVPITARLRDLDGTEREQDAVVVTYYTWIGGDPSTQIPYPRTSAGIRRFTFRANTPLTAGIEGGYRVKVQVYNPGVKVRVVETDRAQAAGYWYDFATDDLVGVDNTDNTTGIVYGTYGKGRFVYMGFQRNAMGMGPADREDWIVLAEYFANVMNYLLRKPVIWVHDWPHPYNAAAMITGIGESQVENFSGVVDALNQARFPGTFMVKPDEVGPYGALMKRLYDNGDVGVFDTLQYRSDGSILAQAARLKRQRETLERIVDGPVKGYRSNKAGMYSANTQSGLVEAGGYTYFIPDSIGRRTAPWIMGFPFETLVRIGVTSRGYRDLRSGTTVMTPDVASTLTREGIDRARYDGSLYHLIYSSDDVGGSSELGTIRDIARTLKAGDFWAASGDSLAHWWRLHKGLNTDVEQRGPSRIFVRVSNDNGDIAHQATVSIALGRAVTAVNIRPELINIFNPVPDERDIPQYELRENGTVLVLPIRELKPQQYRIFHIDLLGPDRTPFRSDN